MSYNPFLCCIQHTTFNLITVLLSTSWKGLKMFSCPSVDGDKHVGVSNVHWRLGQAGLALHYANVITQIVTLVSLLM